MRSSRVVLISAACSIGAIYAGCGDEVEAPTGATTGDAVSVGTWPKMNTGGAGVACEAADTCPGDDGECSKRTCEEGVCGVAKMPAGTLGSSQVMGDCKRNECDAEGALVSVNDDADVQDDAKGCTLDACAAGSPTHDPRPMGAACNEPPGKLCDGAGKCVECLVDADCASGLCDMNACVPASCTDGARNGDETDEDCGGSCNPCIAGKMCLVDADCDSLVCAAGICLTSECWDFVKNGSETDVDCGGACAPCMAGKHCLVAADCTSQVCGGSPPVCLAAGCGDLVKNGSESDVDCGGSECAPCPVGRECNVASDCQSTLCSAAGICIQLNGCDPTNVIDMTGISSVAIAFGGATGLKYAPKCIRVAEGTLVTFNGSFTSHPLHAGLVENAVPTPDAPGTSPLPTSAAGQNSGNTATFTMSPPGVYGYYCGNHLTFSMNGAIFVE